MNPFSVVSYCQQNLSSLPSLPSALLQRRTSSNVVHVVVQTSSPSVTGSAPSLHKQVPTSAHGGPLPPHASSPSPPPTFPADSDRQLQPPQNEKEKEDKEAEINRVNKPRNNPQAILPEMEGKGDRCCSDSPPEGTAQQQQQQQQSVSARIKEQKKELRRHSSVPMAQTSALFEAEAIPKRASFDSERSRVLESISTVGSIKATTMVSQPRPLHLRHLRTFSSPAILHPAPSLDDKPLSVTSTPLLNIPAVCPTVDQAQVDDSESEIVAELESEEERGEADEEEDQEGEQHQEEDEEEVEECVQSEIKQETIRDLEVPKTPLPPIVPPPSLLSTPSSSISRSEPIMAPAPHAALTLWWSLPCPLSTHRTSLRSHLQLRFPGRSRAMIPNIPRPSPLMPFRAARSVVHQVTAAGTGMIPSKEQLGAIPVAGRFMKHPVMDSTLDYIANKATERGISLGGLTSGVQDRRKLILPEDIHYRKLNKTLIHQAMTLSVLAVQKEELSKAIDDEAGDDAFELYLAAINTLLHALPFETCDPLRREAFESQLRTFLDEQLEDDVGSDHPSDAGSTKRLRRNRRRRHRHHHTQATSLIQQHTMAVPTQPSTQSQKQKPKAQSQKPSKYTQPQEQQQKSKKQQSSSKDIKSKSEKPPRAQTTRVSAPSKKGSDDKSDVTPHRHRHRRHRRRGGSRDDQFDDVPAMSGGTGIGDAIISTAVSSAIRLKQSPIPDVVKTCLRTSGRILHHVDERFHLQDKAWELSKQSIEKAIELDEQYAIHEVVTETVFATLTGLVKAGIAYKETPSYSDVKAAIADGPMDGTTPNQALPGQRPNHPQSVPKDNKDKHQTKRSKKSSKSKLKDIPEEAVSSAASRRSTLLAIRDRYWRRNSVAAEEPVAPISRRSRRSHHSRRRVYVEEDNSSDSEDSDDQSSSLDSEDSDLSSSSTSASNSDEEDSESRTSDDSEDDDEEEDVYVYGRDSRHSEVRASVELNEETLRSIPRHGYAGTGRLPPAKAPSATPYTDQVREKIGMFMALKGAASLVVGNLS
ncbi:hypothetical protein EMPS_05311 [Entomortierella parvispora]|uniref:Uncharacterized protein n=1 Tax=Entomortierella parvispora TaxID=205924 RepID=A0A9P3LWD2_9FUNG|nr:hypothetical protein EMPS_05311 [Entomortierella parvispora]